MTYNIPLSVGEYMRLKPSPLHTLVKMMEMMDALIIMMYYTLRFICRPFLF
jgi:hypothetical protein